MEADDVHATACRDMGDVSMGGVPGAACASGSTDNKELREVVYFSITVWEGTCRAVGHLFSGRDEGHPGQDNRRGRSRIRDDSRRSARRGDSIRQGVRRGPYRLPEDGESGRSAFRFEDRGGGRAVAARCKRQDVRVAVAASLPGSPINDAASSEGGQGGGGQLAAAATAQAPTQAPAEADGTAPGRLLRRRLPSSSASSGAGSFTSPARGSPLRLTPLFLWPITFMAYLVCWEEPALPPTTIPARFAIRLVRGTGCGKRAPLVGRLPGQGAGGQ